MWVVRGETGSTRAFHNTGWPDNRSTYSRHVRSGTVAVSIHRKVTGALVGYEPISN